MNSNTNTEGSQGNQSSPTPSAPVESKADNNMLLGILSYLGPLVIVSYLVGKDNPTTKFHIKQGLVLFSIEVILWILGMMSLSLWMILNLVHLATFILSIVGIVNVVQGKQKELPLVGGLSKHFTF